MRWFFHASVSDCSNPRLCRLLLCILPSPSRFSNPHHIHHTGSSSHLGVTCLRPRISDCHTRSFAQLDVAPIRTKIPITHPDFLYLPVAVLLHSHLPTAPPPPFSFLRVFQGGLKLFFSHLLAPPYLPPPPPYFIPCLPCAYLKKVLWGVVCMGGIHWGIGVLLEQDPFDSILESIYYIMKI